MAEPADPKAVQVTYSEAFPDVLAALAKVDRPGSYVASGVWETPIPSLRIAGGEPLSFPVPAAQAKALIKSAGEKAPYGRGAETLLDESVRRVWQVAPQQVEITGQGWADTLGLIVSELAHGLGCQEGSVTAEFYKLLVYEKGSFFKAHRDSEKVAGMFGTLIVVLPSAHQGGELSVRHAGRETVLDLSGAAPSEVSWAGFYADCEHEVAPIRSGYRLCLVYNLVRKSAAPNAAPDNRPAIGELVSALREWRGRYAGEGVPQKLIYLLDHHYTPAGLAFTNLKNRDDATARAFRAASFEAGCSIHLGIVHIAESGWAQYNGDHHSYGRWRRGWDDDDDDDDDDDQAGDDFEIGEVCDWDYGIGDWIDADGFAVEFGKVPLSGSELLPPGALDDAVPDEIHFSEATGNEGASFDRTYLRAAVVVWPDEAADQICLSAGLEAGVARLGKLASGVSARVSTKAALARFAKLLCTNWKPKGYAIPKVTIGDPLRILAEHGDPKLLAECLQALLPAHFGKGGQNQAIAEAVIKLKPAAAGKILAAIFTAHARGECAACLDLWSRVANLAATDAAPPWLRQPLEILVARLAKANGNRPPSTTNRSGRWHQRLTDRFAVGGAGTGALKNSTIPKLDADTLTTWLLLVAARCTDRLGIQAVEALCANPGGFPPDTLVAPSIAKLDQAGFPGEWLERLWAHTGRFLARRSPRPPAPPKDWKQTARWTCECVDCRVLRPFVADPKENVLRMPIAQLRRAHIHQIIDRNGLDMRHETERKGSPYTLVCTKTRTAHEKKCLRHAADVKVMRMLERSSALAVTTEALETLEKVRRAIKASTNKSSKH